MIGGIGRTRNPRRDEPGHVGRVNVAAAGEICVKHFLQFLNYHRLEFYVIAAKVVGEIEFGGRAGLHAYRGTVQLFRTLHVALFCDHESLAVVEINADEVESETGIARERPCGIA